MNRFFRPYEGKRPFLFISYAHASSEQVVETIRILHEGGVRLWYDEGIPAGSDWPANIAQHMQHCERVLFFLSERALASANCCSEMRAAARQGKDILIVRLDDTPIDERWADILGGKPEIPVLQTATERAEAILRSRFIRRKHRRRWSERIPWRALGLAVSLMLFLAAAGALGALVTGRWTPAPPAPPTVTETPTPTAGPTPAATLDIGEAEKYFAVKFPDWLQEATIRSALGQRGGEVYRWQLAEITELYFCGGVPIDSLDPVSCDESGTYRVNGAPVILGPVQDLSLLSYTVRLEKLALICEPFDDPGSLRNLVLLRELTLSGSSLQTLSGLPALPSLETLHLEHTQLRDLRPLETQPNLKTVTVSRNMLPLIWSDSASFTVVLVP